MVRKLFFALVLVTLTAATTGCANLVLVKQCSKIADDSDRYVCRNVKPWE